MKPSPYSCTPVGMRPAASDTPPLATRTTPRPKPRPTRPTADEVLDRMQSFGHTNEEVGIVLSLCHEAASLIENIDCRGGICVLVDMRAHDLLEKVMPGRAYPEPGSVHELLNRFFELPPGCTYLHGRDGDHCLMKIVRR